jgi:hypothetical protein
MRIHDERGYTIVMALKTESQKRDEKDLEIINRNADKLNEEAKDVLSYLTVEETDDNLEEPPPVSERS